MVLALIIVGDILVCAFLAGLAAWLFASADDEKQKEVARLPLLSDAQTLQLGAGGKENGKE